MMRFYWEDIWAGFALIVCVCLVILVSIIAYSNKDIQYYYLENSAGSNAITCVKAYRPWEFTNIVSCVPDYNVAYQEMKQLTEDLKVKK